MLLVRLLIGHLVCKAVWYSNPLGIQPNLEKLRPFNKVASAAVFK